MEIRKKSVVVLLGIAIAGIVGASAASLGLTTENLGADAKVVAACDSAIDASYISTYNATNQEYEVTGVKLSNVAAACNGQNYSITLDNGTPPGVEKTGIVALGVGTSFTATFTGVSAKLITNLAVVISG